MQLRKFPIAVVVLSATLLTQPLLAQTEPVAKSAPRNEIYGGYSYLSNSFNSHAEFRGPGLNGWDAAATIPIFKGLGVKVATFGAYGSSLGDSQQAHFFLAGVQYSKQFGKEYAFVHGLAGLGYISDATLSLGGQGPSSNLSMAADAGGGLDTPIAKRLAWRIEAALLYTDFTAASDQIHGSPNYFAHISTGIVWRF